MRPRIGVWLAIVIMSAAAIAVIAGAAPARAENYPSRPITVIVPFPAGGASDVVARIVTNQMALILGQSIIVENVGGAGGTIGSARVAAAAPDGYTLLAAAMGSHVAAPVLMPNAKYNPLTDFAPIGITAHAPAVVIARKDFPAQDLKEFVAALRQQDGAVKQAHGGIGASSHMACLLFTRTDRGEAHARCLSRLWSGVERPGRRPRRLHVRTIRQRGGGGAGRFGQSLRGVRWRAPDDAAGCTDRPGSRHQL
jgi:hypothetical protein